MLPLTLLAFIATLPGLFAQGTSDWHRRLPHSGSPGSLHYVGTADLAAYLIHTPQGNILINSNYEEDVPLMKASMEKLGFKNGDTKIILISHAHGDHDAAVGLIQRETGAKAHGDVCR